ncbi:MAG TPA: LysM peptidoglycan-binding domain-containing protein [Xanthomonadaceae bacterium]|nr:LysM peptidoglycan-binding domain-containing protein [Xanthomonadaceae bacterium]
MSPQNPNDPGNLSLQPSKAAAGKPDFSNVQGQSDTVPGSGPTGSNTADFSDVQGHADTVPASGGTSYTVKPGDTLSHIAQHVYGKASHWHAIFEANRDQIKDPDLIRPGQVLQLPPVD